MKPSDMRYKVQRLKLRVIVKKSGEMIVVSQYERNDLQSVITGAYNHPWRKIISQPTIRNNVTQ